MRKIIFILYLFFFQIDATSFSKENNFFTSTGNFQSHRFSNLNKINHKNIKNLKIAWIYKNKLQTKDDPTAANALTPILIDKSIIFGSLDNYLISIDSKNGKENWKKKYKGYKNIAKRGLTFHNIKINNVNKNIIFLPTNKTILAIDSENGEIFNSIGNNGKFGENGTGLAPIIINNNIYISSSSIIESYQISDYKKNWSINLNGARVWSGFSYDDKTNSLIVVTSDPADLIYSRTKKFEHNNDNNSFRGYGESYDVNENNSSYSSSEVDYTNSMVIIDANTGKIRCSFQDIKHDHWDLDMVGHPIVVNKKINNSSQNIVFGFSKTGNVIVANLDTCKFHFKNSYTYVDVSKPDKSIKNVNYSSTQKKFIKPKPVSSIRYDFADYLKSIKNKNKRDYMIHKTRHAKYNESFIPLSLNHDVILIGLHGGPQWPGGSFDKKNNQIIVSTNHDPWIIRVYYEDQIFRIKRGLNIRLKRLIDKYDFLSSYKKKELLDKNLDSRIRRFVESTDYHSSYKIFKGSFNMVDKVYFGVSRFFHLSGSKIYKNKCLSCHGHYRQSYLETEFTGDKFIPSLTNISLLPRFNSLKNLDRFNYTHKYIDKKIEISSVELKQVSEYFNNLDEFLNKLNLTHIAYKWQILLDKDDLPASKSPWGKITAFDVDTGRVNWSIDSGETIKGNIKVSGSTNFGGLLTTSTNIVFATGTSDEKIYAYNTSSGSEIWNYKLPLSGSSPPMTYMNNDEQYILVNASGGRYYNYRKSNSEYLIAFKLNAN